MLPDGYEKDNGHVLFEFEEYPEDVQLLLCSDGLYDGFRNFKGLRNWLSRYRGDLSDSTPRNERLSELHRKLSRKAGDDDISFMWLYPGRLL